MTARDIVARRRCSSEFVCACVSSCYCVALLRDDGRAMRCALLLKPTPDDGVRDAVVDAAEVDDEHSGHEHGHVRRLKHHTIDISW